jgi:hypothetical protein
MRRIACYLAADDGMDGLLRCHAAIEIGPPSTEGFLSGRQIGRAAKPPWWKSIPLEAEKSQLFQL